ncbi:MAG: hypothetical protein F6J86_06785 [Symploca sp. SIO1B1]|nr:hypothetical protein [Symploca sp. SIO1B1]
MKQKTHQAKFAAKIKKWVEAAQQLRTENIRFALPITRLTSIKSLCQDEIAAQQFALYFSKQVEQQINTASLASDFTPEELEIHKSVIAEGIEMMERFLETPTHEGKQSIRKLLRQIDDLQGDDVRNFRWSTVHFVRSGYLLKLDYALRCFVEPDFSTWAYKLAREYAEGYEPQYGTGLIPSSAPMLLEIAEFWCQYYLGQSLTQKFPQLMKEDTLTNSS